MGSTGFIHENEKEWNIDRVVKNEISGEEFILVVVGEIDDDVSSGYLCRWMSKKTFDNILSRKYSIKNISRFKDKYFDIYDENNILIEM